jgi:hypothetical protein
MKKPPKALDAIADVVLRYRPTAKTQAQRKRRSKARKAAKKR